MKKTLAILLSLALVICMIPATASVAFADTVTVTNVTCDAIPQQEYTGKAIKPEIKGVKATVNGETRTLNNDEYNVTYSDDVTALGNNSSAVTITTNIEGSTAVAVHPTFVVVPRNLNNITVDIPAQTYDGVGEFDEGDLNWSVIKIKDSSGEELKLSHGSDGEIVVSVEANGTSSTSKKLVIVPRNNATQDGNKVVINTRYTCVFDIGKTISNWSINGVSNAVYTGKKIEFKDISVVDTGNGNAVIDKENYKVKYSNNLDAGSATVTVEGQKGYVGSTSLGYTIAKAAVADAKASGLLKIEKVPSQVLVGSKVEPEIRVYETVNGVSKALVKGTDYTVAYGDNNSVGIDTGTATVTFTKNYEGTHTETFAITSGTDINSANVKVASPTANSTATYNGSSRAVTVTMTDSGKTPNTMKENTDFVVWYEDSVTKVKTKSPVSAANYNILVEGIGSYGGTRNTGKTLTISKANVSSTTVQGLASTYAYTGKPITPDFTLYLGSYKLVKGVDYTVTYTNNTYNLSSTTYRPTITVTGTGTNFTGTKTMYFAIGEKSIYSCNISFADGRTSAVYTGNTIYPEVKVYENGILLTKGTHYSVTYKDAAGKTVYGLRDTGTYTVEVKGLNGYTGTRTLTFTITGTDISNYTVTLKESSVTATGYSQTPVITSVKYGYYSSLSSNDYTVSYQDATGKTVYSMSAPGTYRVVVTGKNGYSGTTYATFRIVGLPQTVTVTQDSYKVYDDSDVFKITAKATGDGTGFTYTSSNPAVASVSSTGYVTPNKVGRAVITVTTTGNKKYEPTSKQVVVKVYPDKAKLSKKPWTDGKASQLKVRWGYQDGVTKYQVRYSRDKNFSSGSYLTKTVKAHGKSYTTQSTTLSNLKRGYTYYVKVRAVYTDPVAGETYYGSWSPWKSGKTI